MYLGKKKEKLNKLPDFNRKMEHLESEWVINNRIQYIYPFI